MAWRSRGDDLTFDLIVVRTETRALEKVQCKYTTSDGRVVMARVMSNSAWVTHRYTKVDWIGVYATTERCFYLPFSEWTGGDGESPSGAHCQRPGEGDPLRRDFTTSWVIPVSAVLAQCIRCLYHWTSRRSSSVVEQPPRKW